MKKTILCLSFTLIVNLISAQFLTTGTVTTDNKYRLGGIGLGYSSLPSFGANKFLVNGDSFFSGNVGIGTQTPTSKFQIATGDAKIDTGSLLIGTSSAYNDTASNWGINSDKPFQISSNIYPAIRLNSIGTSPFGQGNFAVATSDYFFSRLAKKGDVVISGNSKGSFIIANEFGGDIKFETTEDPTNDMSQYLTSKTRFLMDKSGNIGIGTGDMPLNPNDLLAVNGLIHAKEVKVDLVGWPDYVFESNYNLKPLQDLEVEIKKLGHLPNVPSAKEVEENGVKLGEMNKKLLEKVEELTLYVIQLNKEIEKLKTKKE